MTEALTGLLFGVTLGLSVSPMWLLLNLPQRTSDVLDGGSMALCALALTLGATLGAAEPFSAGLGVLAGVAGMLAGGMFTGMLAAGLTEALEVIPALYTRLGIAQSMRSAAWALALGKTAGAVLAQVLVK